MQFYPQIPAGEFLNQHQQGKLWEHQPFCAPEELYSGFQPSKHKQTDNLQPQPPYSSHPKLTSGQVNGVLLGRTPRLHGSAVNLFQLHFAAKIKTTIKSKKRREGTLPLTTEPFSSERPFRRRAAPSPASEGLSTGTHASFRATNQAKIPADRGSTRSPAPARRSPAPSPLQRGSPGAASRFRALPAPSGRQRAGLCLSQRGS